MNKANRFLRLMLIIVVFGLCMPTISAADDSTSDTGNELINNCNDNNYQALNASWVGCIGYVSGVYDGIGFGAMNMMKLEHNNLNVNQLIAMFKIGFDICIPVNVTRGQDALVVTKYLHDHPDKLNEDSWILVVDAFQTAWPCPKSGK